jgi:type I restriction enzyme S subunit
MNNQTNTRVPKLRFPEFRNTSVWEEKSIAKICDVLNSRRMPISSDNREKGYYPYYGASGIVDYVKDFIFDERLLLVGEDGAKWGAFEKTAFTAEGKYWVNNHAHVLRTTTINDTLLENYLTMLDLTPFITGAAPPKLTLGKLKDIPIPIPPTEGEQQKIADCLSSIDELITAQTQKLDTLKTHKKGLMQQLFPAEGETVPKLRFPEFRDAGEWEEKKFGEICKFVRGPFGGSLKKDIFVKDGYAVYEQTHAIHQTFDTFRYYITKEKFNELKRFSVHPNDIIMSCSGTMGKFSIIPQESKSGVINQALLKLTVKKELNIEFIKTTLELPINQEKLLSQSAGGAIKNVVSVDQIKEIDLYIPALSEQKKIADCLASVDELIAAQVQKVEALKQHKKGLMQQLFPAAEEVAG